MGEIEAETKRYLQQHGKVVSADPIQLTVYSPLVPNLTLVDMPGIDIVTDSLALDKKHDTLLFSCCLASNDQQG
jgi:hypothetical protein